MTYEGTVVLNYALTRKLGSGGFGSVYLAEHTTLGRRVACKILHREFISETDVVDRFFREAKSVCAIGHRAIVDIENFGHLPGGEPFYLMEYLDGESLADRVKRLPLTITEMLDVFGPVTSALAAAHRKQIVHRDLKPENIMIREEQRRIVDVKLLDFGIAKLVAAADAVRSRSGVPMGTPLYMPPEQALDAKSADERSDIYSLAATIYVAVSGHPLFIADSVAAILIKVQLESPLPLRHHAPELPAELERAIQQCLDKNPARRPPSIVDAWNLICASVGNVAVQETLPPPAPTSASVPWMNRPFEQRAGVATTLGAASGQSQLDRPHRGRTKWFGAGATVIVVAVGVVFIARMSGDRAARPPPSETPWPVASQTRGSVIDAAVTELAPDASVTAPVRTGSAAPPDHASFRGSASPPVPARRRTPTPHPDRNPSAAVKPDPVMTVPARVEQPTTAPPPTPDIPDCSVASFEAVYNAPRPIESDIRAALVRLKACQSRMASAKFDQIQRNLVSKL